MSTPPTEAKKATFAQEIINIPIEAELKQSYMDYAMSVIVSRALPDVRDGLKPVHRRVLYAMNQLNNDWNKAYKKSARIVGDVIGKYHPHGDTAVYDTIVRMAQPFSLRYMLVDGQGNFGSVDGDSPAAMRYTEIRLAKISHKLLDDLEKDTVDFLPNYDETEFAPAVLPAQFPNLLVNGSSGIAVGMATNIPPHNLGEIIDACVTIIDSPEVTLSDILQLVPGPDFPTAAIINGRAGILQAYKTGRGKIYLRSKTHVETDERNGRESIIIDELPYQVNKATLQEKMAGLVKIKQLEGISAIRDESDKDGMRVVIELKRGESNEVVLNNLYRNTQMQITFGINMVGLDHGQPKVFNLMQLLHAFLLHRREVVTRRTIFEVNKAKARAHILEGLAVALANIDEIVALIRKAKDPATAKAQMLAKVWPAGIVGELLLRSDDLSLTRPETLTGEFGIQEHDKYRLSEVQAQAILDLRLHRLTGLEQDKIIKEYNVIIDNIKGLLEILGDPDKLMQVIREELLAIKSEFNDTRRTEIIDSQLDMSYEDLIQEEDMVVTLSKRGYVKRLPVSEYQAQRRGGKGRSVTKVKDEDFVEQLVMANTHDTILCFSNIGKVYWLKVYMLPSGSRQAGGKPIVNLLPLTKGEHLSAILPIREYSAEQFVFMATQSGTVKKVSLDNFSRPRANGIIAVDLADDDKLIGVDITDGKRDIMLFSDAGKVVRFNESQVRAMGRGAKGVRGMKLKPGQKVISLVVVDSKGGAILTATENGYGKRTKIEDYSQVNRGAQGVISIQVTKRNGQVVGALQVSDDDEIMLVSDQGTLIRTRVDEVSIVGRNTQGVCLINVCGEEKLIALERVN